MLPKRVDSNPLTTLARDVGEMAESVRRIRTDQALSSLPSNLVRVTTEQQADGTIRVGLINVATGGTAWLTSWF